MSRKLEHYNHLVHQYTSKENANTLGLQHGITEKNGRVISFQEYMDQVAVPQIHKGLSNSLYVHHFRQWIRLFDPKQVLIINGDGVKQKPEKVQWRVRHFLLHAKLPGKMARFHGSKTGYQMKLPPL